MRNIAIAELGYEVVEERRGLKIYKVGRPYTLTAEEEKAVVTRTKVLEYEQYSSQVQKAVQKHVDDLAKAHRYDSMMSVRSYTGFPNEFQRECMRMSIWAGDVWSTVTKLETQVKSGEIPMPTIDGLIGQLPTYEEM